MYVLSSVVSRQSSGPSMLTIRVPGSTSNLGAGFDCIGLALDLWLEARIVLGQGPARLTGAVAELSPEHEIISEIIGETLPDDHHLEIHSDIPIAKGLGSSAAASVAGIALRETLRHREPDRDRVFRNAADREGHPDNAGPSVYGGLVLSSPNPVMLKIDPRFAVALALPTAPSTPRKRENSSRIHCREAMPSRRQPGQPRSSMGSQQGTQIFFDEGSKIA